MLWVLHLEVAELEFNPILSKSKIIFPLELTHHNITFIISFTPQKLVRRASIQIQFKSLFSILTSILDELVIIILYIVFHYCQDHVLYMNYLWNLKSFRFQNLCQNIISQLSVSYIWWIFLFNERNSTEINIFLNMLFLLHLVSLLFPRILEGVVFVLPSLELLNVARISKIYWTLPLFYSSTQSTAVNWVKTLFLSHSPGHSILCPVSFISCILSPGNSSLCNESFELCGWWEAAHKPWYSLI